VEKNHRTRHGEIDLILRRGGLLVFCEVKVRRGAEFGGPLEAVTPRKRERIRGLAELYLAENEPEFDELRFDVVGIELAGGASGRAKVMHVPEAF
jgi:putative endonuclease